VPGVLVQPVQYSYVFTTTADLRSSVPRGSDIIVGQERFRVSAGGLYTSSQVTLDSMYLHPTPGSPVAVYAASTAEAAVGGTGTGTYVVTYLPLIRGTYRLDITLPPVQEVVTIRIEASTALAGDYYIKVGDQTAGPFLVSATASSIGNAFTALSNIVGPVSVVRHSPLRPPAPPISIQCFLFAARIGVAPIPIRRPATHLILTPTPLVSCSDHRRGPASRKPQP
jgi:hypothetical protein